MVSQADEAPDEGAEMTHLTAQPGDQISAGFTAATQNRPQVGQKARVTWANSLHRGETGIVTEVTPRGIVTLRLEDGTIGSWSRQHLDWDRGYVANVPGEYEA